MKDEILNWLLEGDVSIQYQVYRDLLMRERDDIRKKIVTRGWGQKFLSARNSNGHWGLRFYQPKWISTHYTLLDLRNICISNDIQEIRDSIKLIVNNEKSPDGGINPALTIPNSDICVNGMFLNYASYFKTDEKDLQSVVDLILLQIMPDGGFNCMSNMAGAKHSSLHSTLSVLEGITEYELNGYKYRKAELTNARRSAVEFILKHRLFLSDRTGKVIRNDFLKLTYPGRWKYDILKAMDYFQYSNTGFDHRMEPAIEVITKKRKGDGRWNLQAKHPGQEHFVMEKAGNPSRWNTLRALRVLKHYGIE